MNNRCILEQLGYDINDDRVTKSSDGYIDVKLADNLYVGADRDCSSITIHTYNKDILDIDLRTYDACSDIEFRIPTSLYWPSSRCSLWRLSTSLWHGCLPLWRAGRSCASIPGGGRERRS